MTENSVLLSVLVFHSRAQKAGRQKLKCPANNIMNVDPKKWPKVSAKIVEITLEQAREKLSSIKSNRDISSKSVQAWVRIINTGLFRPFGIFFENGHGEPYDGQHRFSAQIQTQTTQTYICISGLDPESMNMMIDSGRPRTVAQRLNSIGYSNGSTLASAIGRILEIEEGKDMNQLFIDEVLGFLNQHPEIAAYTNAWSKEKSQFLPVSMVIAFQYLFYKSDSQKADEFLIALHGGQDKLKIGHPALAALKLIDSLDIDSKKRNDYIYNALVMAWNAFKKSEELAELHPTLNPQPIQ